MDMHWIYHPTETAQVVDTQEYERLMDTGEWYDNPANFPVIEAKVEVVAETKVDAVDKPILGSGLARKKVQ